MYVPPFSFEYLQNAARYFAQHAAQMERMYIQFRQSAENETLREQQLEQQVEVASATVELENRSLREAQEAKDVTEANLNYATVQRNNAQQASAAFANVRWQLAELDSLVAWRVRPARIRSMSKSTTRTTSTSGPCGATTPFSSPLGTVAHQPQP